MGQGWKDDGRMAQEGGEGWGGVHQRYGSGRKTASMRWGHGLDAG